MNGIKAEFTKRLHYFSVDLRGQLDWFFLLEVKELG